MQCFEICFYAEKNLTAVIDFLSEKHLFVALNALYGIDHEDFQ